MEGQNTTQAEKTFYFSEKKNNGSTEYTPIKCTSDEFKSLKDGVLTLEDIKAIKSDKDKIVKQEQTIKK